MEKGQEARRRKSFHCGLSSLVSWTHISTYAGSWFYDGTICIVCNVEKLTKQILQAEEYAQKHNLEIVGYCHANELFDDRQLGTLAKRIAGKIEKNYAGACILLVRKCNRMICK